MSTLVLSFLYSEIVQIPMWNDKQMLILICPSLRNCHKFKKKHFNKQGLLSIFIIKSNF